MRSNLPGRADALWRAITYVAVAQLHLSGNPLLQRPLTVDDMKPHPSGHWGTVPGTAWMLAHIGLATAARPDVDVVPVIGAGHAGVAQISLAWLTGDLAKVSGQFTSDLDGLTRLVTSFPEVGGLGTEVHPLLPGGSYMGGALGGALAFAQGAALHATHRVLVPILGDGECETPTTAAAWLAQEALTPASVLPVVHLNGHRMGGPSLLAAMSDDQLRAYAVGLGWQPTVFRITRGTPTEHERFHHLLLTCLDGAYGGERRMIFLRCVKGWTGPTPGHKTPLTDLAGDPHQQLLLKRWLVRYKPNELFDGDGQPVGLLADALGDFRIADLPSCNSPAVNAVISQQASFAEHLPQVLRSHAQKGGFAVFSPDELSSNRLGELACESWVYEVLAEEILVGWLAGWTSSGRRGLVISYEAFAPMMLTSLIGLLKQRRLGPTLPSINLLLTSYGWHNAYTHSDPSLITALLATGDPAVHIFTPADAYRTAVVLNDALQSDGCVNVIIAGKHPTDLHPVDALADERANGLAIWHHLTDAGKPDLVLVCAGDLPAGIVGAAAERIRSLSSCRVRVVNVHELAGLARPEADQYLDLNAAILILTLGHPAAIWGLLAGRGHRAVDVVGWREPQRPMTQRSLAEWAGLDVEGVVRAGTQLLKRRAVPQ